MSFSRLRSLSCFLLVLLWAVPVIGQQREPVRYALNFPALVTHYVEVEASIPTDGQARVDLMMPVWTPGSYLVREYSRSVEALTAQGDDGASLAIEKTRKNRWRVAAKGVRTLTLRYRVYCHEMSVRTNWVDDRFALLNGAATFITRLEARDRPYEVRIQLPPGWSSSVSAMAPLSPNVYRAPDYDTLVDSPIIAGDPARYEFNVAGKPYVLVDVGEDGAWDGAKAAKDLQKVVEETTRFWRVVPYDRYLFFNVIGWPNNGLEHKTSVMMNTPRDSTGTRASYLGWLRLASHEFFHAWNVKRLRPIELGPFDYENEVYTKGLWFAEGVTDYYADLQLHRAGVSTRDEYLSELSQAISALQTTPGRLEQPAEMASYDAWIKYYRPDENSPNTSISYYVKGSVIGFLLDARIRRDTGGAKSLDDLMRLMYQRFSGAKGFTSEDLRATAGELVGKPASDGLRAWLVNALETTKELDYRDALDWYGLEFRSGAEKPRAWLGVGTRTEGPRTVIASVRRGSPAFDAGLDINDELAAVNDVTLAAGQLTARLAQFAPGDKVSLTILRRGVRQQIGVTLASDPAQAWQLAVSGNASSQNAHLQTWLGAGP